MREYRCFKFDQHERVARSMMMTFLVGHREQSSDGQTLVGGRFGSRDAEIRRARHRGAGRGQEQSLRGDNRHGKIESLARHDAVRFGGRVGDHDRGRPTENLTLYITTNTPLPPLGGKHKRNERVFNCSNRIER